MYNNIFVIYNISDEGVRNICLRDFFLLGAGNLMRSDFDHLNLSQS